MESNGYAATPTLISRDGGLPQWQIIDRENFELTKKYVPIEPIYDQLTPKPGRSPESASSDIQPVQVKEKQSPWILGIGGGLRFENSANGYLSNPKVFARVGRLLDPETAISLRPSYIFGNVDPQNNSNNQGVFQLPVTLDIAPNSWLSPYAGAGITTNTDSMGGVNPMFTVGLDVRLLKQLTLNIGANYIVQSTNDSNYRDLEAYSVIYFRF